MRKGARTIWMMDGDGRSGDAGEMPRDGPDAMTVSDKAARPRRGAVRRTWRYRLGLWLFVASFPLFYATLVVVPLLGLPAGQTALLMSMLLVAFYGLWLASLPLLGRQGFGTLKGRSRGWLRLWRARAGRRWRRS